MASAPPAKRPHAKTASFGRRADISPLADAGALARPFGKRRKECFQRVRLIALYSQLLVLFEDKACPGGDMPFALRDGITPYLEIGETARISIDIETGLYVLQEQDDRAELMVITVNEERIIDHAICYLSRIDKMQSQTAAEQAVRYLVGRPVDEVERCLILQTLRHCHGNRTHAARLLGISLRTIRNKLKEYWQTGDMPGQDRA